MIVGFYYKKKCFAYNFPTLVSHLPAYLYHMTAKANAYFL